MCVCVLEALETENARTENYDAVVDSRMMLPFMHSVCRSLRLARCCLFNVLSKQGTETYRDVWERIRIKKELDLGQFLV